MGMAQTTETLKRKFQPDPKPVPRPKKKRGHIRPVAARKLSDKAKYNREVKEWKRGKQCACNCNKPCDDNHHVRGCEGYADNEKYLRGISLLHDKDFWLPVCRDHHREIHDNSKWAYENGYSELRAKNVYR